MFLIPFKDINLSGTFDANFLWNSNQIYIMDNHRCAAWCWALHISNQNKFGLIHIDAHYDWTPQDSRHGGAFTLPSSSLQSMSIEKYLSSHYIRWDNYLTVFLYEVILVQNKFYE
jgi:hypothetical protein